MDFANAKLSFLIFSNAFVASSDLRQAHNRVTPWRCETEGPSLSGAGSRGAWSESSFACILFTRARLVWFFFVGSTKETKQASQGTYRKRQQRYAEPFREPGAAAAAEPQRGGGAEEEPVRVLRAAPGHVNRRSGSSSGSSGTTTCGRTVPTFFVFATSFVR